MKIKKKNNLRRDLPMKQEEETRGGSITWCDNRRDYLRGGRGTAIGGPEGRGTEGGMN